MGLPLKKADIFLFFFFLAAAALLAATPFAGPLTSSGPLSSLFSSSADGGAGSSAGGGQSSSQSHKPSEDLAESPAASSCRIVKVLYGGELIGLYPLDQDEDIEIVRDGHRNLVSIRDNTVRMEQSDCKNQICVNTGTISRTGELIVCLPNQVIVEIVSAKGGEDNEGIDAVVK